MSDKDTKDVKPKKNFGKIRIIFSSMVLFVLLIAEIYMMIHSTEYFAGLVTVTVLMIAVLYILITSAMQVNYEKQLLMNELFEDIFKSEKASYLLMRKNFEEMDERLSVIEDNMKTPTEEIIEAQKAIAKVSISRNRENADALMNSNDKLLDKIIEFEGMIYANNDKIINQQREMIDQANKEVLMKYQEGLAKIREVELSIKNEILQSVNKISSIQPQIVLSTPQMAQVQQPMQEVVQQQPVPEQNQLNPNDLLKDSQDADLSSGLDLMNEQDLDADAELSFDNLLKQSQGDFSMNESLFEEISPKEGDISEDMSLLNSMLGQDLSFGDSFTEEPLVEEPFAEEEPLMEEEPLIEEESLEEEPLIEEESLEEEPLAEEEPLVEEEPLAEEEPLVEEEPLAEEEPLVEEPLVEEESLVEEEPLVEEVPVEEVVEEKPPMPDLSNPNKIMTPDEIAALLANL